MDLQWQRQTELWLRLMDAGNVAPALNISVEKRDDTYYLEQVGKRANISLARAVNDAEQHNVLLRLLNLLQPEAGAGIPLRAWLAKGKIWLSATAPPESGAELWTELARRQHRLLNRVMETDYENV